MLINNKSHEPFFNLLLIDDIFCQELGRVLLLSGKLESILSQYLEKNKIKLFKNKATLGNLINELDKNGLLSSNLKAILSMMKTQRNYLSHSIYDLLTYQIDETILEREVIIDSDVMTYTERVLNLKENLLGIIEIIEELNIKMVQAE
ncbi:hypothetical protein [Sulfurovum sp.]|uniref:hypothetical protein n=1 Tax=Sulfurovum sp. TaxID=1969726 RepID=UPI0028682E46|nr:hypothetical protein [Sulfurovum sp.]